MNKNEALWLTGQLVAIVIGVLLYADNFGGAKSLAVAYGLLLLIDIRKCVMAKKE